MKKCWLLTTGEAGCISQLKGLAKALNIQYETKRISLPYPWRLFPGHLCPWPLLVTKSEDRRLGPPWPDLVISAGRRTVAAAIAIKKASNGKTKIIHIQDPRVPVGYFDAVIAPGHDNCKGSNVLKTLGAIHHLSKEDILSETEKMKDQYASLPSPRVTVLLGGTSRAFQFTEDIVNQLMNQFRLLHQETGCSFLITPSARTPPEVMEQLKAGLKDTPCSIWNKQGANPYKAFLGLADYILVTCDSISMMSEACVTGKPVYIINMEGHSKRLAQFVQDMQEKGFLLWFEGKLDTWTYPPLDEVARSANFIKNELKIL